MKSFLINETEHLAVLAGYDLIGSYQLGLSVFQRLGGGGDSSKDCAKIVAHLEALDLPCVIESYVPELFILPDGDKQYIIFMTRNVVFITLLTAKDGALSLTVKHRITLSVDTRYFSGSLFTVDVANKTIIVSASNRRIIRTYSIEDGSMVSEYGLDAIEPSIMALDQETRTLVLYYASRAGYVKLLASGLNSTWTIRSLLFIPDHEWVMDIATDSSQNAIHLITHVSPSLDRPISRDLWYQIQAGDANWAEYAGPYTEPFFCVTYDLTTGEKLRNISTGDIFFPSITINGNDLYMQGIHKATGRGVLFGLSYHRPKEVIVALPPSTEEIAQELQILTATDGAAVNATV